MCVYSMITDHYIDKWTRKIPTEGLPYTPGPFTLPYVPLPDSPPAPLPKEVPVITPEEVEEFRELLKRAKKYDEDNNEKDCELESKKEILRELAKKLGVKIDFI